MHFAAIWASCLAGLLAAMPPERFRRPIAMVIAAFAMLAFAYYGIIPSWACIAVLAAAVMLLLSRGSLVSSLTVLLVMAIIFGVIFFIDPGENYGISRVDENLRDRFALRSSYLDSGSSTLNDLENMQDQMEQQEQERNQGSEFIAEHRWIVVLLIIALVLAAAGALVWV